MDQVWLDTCEEACTGSQIARREPSHISEEQAAGIAEVFKALGDPTRVKIIFFLLGKELCVHDLSTLLDMGQSAVSHQLRYLRDLHIVKRRKEGKTVFYSLDDSHIEQIFVQTMGHLHHM
ncbi:ArsR/SmtB family transcription factor [Paenibacillus sp. GCM10023248]|uniref:ArsR/SmtB family transcription factor n=1 Tax=Bacillales TaxID=1385 RepID=UPI002379E2EE|nr:MULTISPECIES: metalloregulator ArsR/SmtB family transcription factor [Bacillales]MDD9265937.1 metalloregulator ArsR/SmtB family transcription factor [Paenibacillus sp. MAHUQ-63]MDR6879175.1 DNA-binding transcriptional ArsR family regulator [Bacillus sp. 3255]